VSGSLLYAPRGSDTWRMPDTIQQYREAVVLVRLGFCFFADYGCLLSPLGLRVKRSLLGILLTRLENDVFYKLLENQLQ